MVQKQDRINPRKPSDLERQYDFKKRFGEANQAAADAMGAAKKAHEAAREADRHVNDLDEKLDQREVFRRLTKNGKAQGVYMDDDGNIYINASYLATGVLASTDGKTFYLDLVNGILKGQFSEFSIAGKTIDEIAGDKINDQTQEDAFNKLTNNGTAQGIYFKDGQLYINASYLAAGILQSLDGSTFYLDIANNVLRGAFSELTIAGKTVEWKDNGDGTFTLIGQ